MNLWPNEVGVGWLCRCEGIVWEPTKKRAHTQLVREHSVTVVSARWAIVDWPSDLMSGVSVRELISDYKKKKKKPTADGKWIVEHFSQILARK